MKTYRTTITLSVDFGDLSRAQADARGAEISRAILDHLPEELCRQLRVHAQTTRVKTPGDGKYAPTTKKTSSSAGGDFPVEDVFSHLGESDHVFTTEKGIIFRVDLRYRRYVFFQKNPTCAACGLRGTAMRLHQDLNSHPGTAHFHLYGVKDGQYVMMTQDHIVPRSKGGTHKYDNKQTLCLPCNVAKGAKEMTLDELRMVRGEPCSH